MAMMGALNGERLSVYYYVTLPQIIAARFAFGVSEPEDLECLLG
jgi:hypothetical protein